MATPDTRSILRNLRDELAALDMAIATFERLAALRGEAIDPEPSPRKPAPKRRVKPDASGAEIRAR